MNLTDQRADVLIGVMNLGVGYAAQALNGLVGAHIELRTQAVTWMSTDEARTRIAALGGAPVSTVQLEFRGSLDGTVTLIVPGGNAVKLVSLLTGDRASHGDLDGLRKATLEEAGNILLNCVVGSIANLFETQISFSVPFYREADRVIERLKARCGETHVLLARTCFEVSGHCIEGEILIYLEVHSLEALQGALDRLG